MRFKKINDNQFSVDLTREDLASRHIKLSELAYGTPQAQELFNEMMTRASAELGVDMEDNPLMIEAIPMGKSDISLRLLITKVEYPEELDMKYSDFTDSDINFSGFGASDGDDSSDSSNASRFLDKLKAAASSLGIEKNDFVPLKDTAKHIDIPFDAVPEVPADISKLFAFEKIDTVITIAKNTISLFDGLSSLYLDEKESVYYLIVRKGSTDLESFTRFCNILSEYGLQLHYMPSAEAFFNEHFRLIKENNALEIIASSCI